MEKKGFELSLRAGRICRGEPGFRAVGKHEKGRRWGKRTAHIWVREETCLTQIDLPLGVVGKVKYEKAGRDGRGPHSPSRGVYT